MELICTEVVRTAIDMLNRYRAETETKDASRSKDAVSPNAFLKRQYEEAKVITRIQDGVSPIFFTILKYKKFLDMLLEDYYKARPNKFPRVPDDQSTILVFSYLAIFQLKESTKNRIHDLLIAVHDRKALAFFKHLKKGNTLTKLFEWGCSLYDIDHVKEILRNVIKENLFEEMSDSLEEYIEVLKKNQVKPPTKPMELSVLKHEKRAASPTKESSSSVVTPRQSKMVGKVPKTTYKKPTDDLTLELMKKKNKSEALKLLQEAQKSAYNCANPKKSKKYYETIDRIQKERDLHKKDEFGKKKVKAITEGPTITPKKTAAVVMREGARIMKEEENEIKRYEELASGAFNAEVFAQWEKDLRDEKIRKHLEDIQKRHLEGLLTYEEALLAKQSYLKKKKEAGEEMRKEREKWLADLEEWRLEEQKRIEEQVAKGRAIGQGAKDAKIEIKEMKQRNAKELTEELRGLKDKALRQKEEELQRKVNMIKEIRALLTIDQMKKKDVDFTETANCGLLCEMSIAELKERLLILRIELDEELEKKREEFRKRRECRQNMVDTYQELIDNHKALKAQMQMTPNSVQSNPSSSSLKQVESSEIDELKKKLLEKRQERLGNIVA